MIINLEMLPYLQPLAKHPRSGVRSMLVHYLARTHPDSNTNVVKEILSILSVDPDPEIAAHAVNAMKPSWIRMAPSEKFLEAPRLPDSLLSPAQ